MPALPLPSNAFVYKRVAGADPAANTEVSTTVPAGKFWWLLSVNVVLVQGATQTPQPVLQIDDGSTVIYESPGSSAAQIASSTTSYTWAPDLPLSGQVGATPNTRSTAPLPVQLLIPAGYRVRTSTLGIGANTDYGVPSYYVIEFG